MALEANAKKTEHCGAKNMGHDKRARREDLKDASRKEQRGFDMTSDEGFWSPVPAYLAEERILTPEEAKAWSVSEETRKAIERLPNISIPSKRIR